jgi:hypothetical protein
MEASENASTAHRLRRQVVTLRRTQQCGIDHVAGYDVSAFHEMAYGYGVAMGLWHGVGRGDCDVSVYD